MFAAILLPLAMTATSIEPQATADADEVRSVVIALDRYDVRLTADIDRLKLRIRTAARTVCDQGYHGVMYLQTGACIRNAVADAHAQLGKLAERKADATLSATIAVTAK